MAAQVLTGAPATLRSALFRRGTQCISATTTDPKTVIGQLMTWRAEIGSGANRLEWRQDLALFIGAACYQKRQRTEPFRACDLESIAIQWLARTLSMA